MVYLGTPVVRIPLFMQFGSNAISTLGTRDEPMPVCEMPSFVVAAAVATVQYLLHSFPSLLIDKCLMLAFVNLSTPEDFADVEGMAQ